MERMNIAAEKEDIIRRFKQVEDVTLIKAFKNLLDFGLNKSNRNAETLEEAIEIGLRQSRNREVVPHEEVMAEFRKKYKA